MKSLHNFPKINCLTAVLQPTDISWKYTVYLKSTKYVVRQRNILIAIFTYIRDIPRQDVQK